MTDPRYTKLARLLINYSLDLKKNDHLLIDTTDTPETFTIELIRAARQAGAIPIIETRNPRLSRETLRHLTQPQANLIRDLELHRIKKMQAYIAIRGAHNANENADIPPPNLATFTKTLRPVQNHRVNQTRWCILRWPTPSMAQAAGMSTETFQNHFFEVCTLDYQKMSRAMQPLVRLMQKTKHIRIQSPGTDLQLNIQNIGAQPCHGDRNIPDGEVFTAPIKNSAQGTIQFNTPTTYAGTTFENIRLQLKNGKIIHAQSNHTKRLNQILDTDPGARYLGEFSLAFNPRILNPIGDILFDEKIAGSLHLTPGQAYQECDNGNRSAIHWDMVLIQRPNWGGGKIWFDNKLIRHNGLFLPKNLQPLNPKNLLKQKT